MKWYAKRRRMMLGAILIFVFSGISALDVYGNGKVIFDKAYFVDSAEIYSIRSNLAAVQIVELEEGNDSMRVTIRLSPELDDYFLTDDFFDYVGFTRQIEEDIIVFDFFIEDAPAYWWKKYYSLKEKVKSEVFNLDFFVPGHFDVPIIEVNNGSLQTFNGFPSITQILLNQSVSNHHGDYWSLYFETENSEVFVESAASLFLIPSYSEFSIFNCTRVEGYLDHSKAIISKAKIIRLYLNFSVLAATYVDLFEESIIGDSKVYIFFANKVDVGVVDSELKLWHLRSEIDLGGYKSNIELRSIARDLKKLKIEGKQIDAKIGGICRNNVDYSLSGTNSEVHLMDQIFIFGEEEELLNGNTGDSSIEHSTNLHLNLMESVIYLCPVID